MNLLVLSTFAVICVLAVESRYPYDDAYVPGDIVPHGINTGYGYGRERGRYPVKIRGSGYGGAYNKRNNRYGRNRDVQIRDYDRRRYGGDYDTHLPPRGLGGYDRQSYDRPGYEYRRNRPQINGPPKYYDDDDVNYGGRDGFAGLGIRYN